MEQLIEMVGKIIIFLQILLVLYSTYSGPSLNMEKPDYRQAASCGSSKEAKAYREAEKKLIEEGKFKEAQQMDFEDIRSKFGDKYDQGIA